MHWGSLVRCLALALLCAIAGEARSLGGRPPDELIVDNPSKLALIVAIEKRWLAGEVPAGLSLRRLHDRVAARFADSGITPHSILEHGCEPVDGREAWFKPPCDAFVEVAVDLRASGVFSVAVRFRRNLQYTVGGKPYYVNAVSWVTEQDGQHEGYAPPVFEAVDKLVDGFLKGFKSANAVKLSKPAATR